MHSLKTVITSLTKTCNVAILVTLVTAPLICICVSLLLFVNANPVLGVTISVSTVSHVVKFVSITCADVDLELRLQTKHVSHLFPNATDVIPVSEAVIV